MNRSVAITTVLAALALASGCASSKPAVAPGGPSQEATSATAPAAQAQAVAEATAENQGGGLSISPEVMRLCPGIKPPKFGYDSAALRDDWAAALRTLSECMTTGALAGKGLLLTGPTDNRGDDDYNMLLGGRRAASVKRALGSFGVAGAQVDVTSRGEVDAVGNEEESWARDRRVDIDLRPSNKVSSR
jgi:peptidoglycan-associated lipoprotein